jgi:hypothetical protein
LKREEAVAIYKEITKLAESMGSNAVNLKLSKKDEPAEGYQICITMEKDPDIYQQITNIAKKHNLAVKEEKNQVIIYKIKKA